MWDRLPTSLRQLAVAGPVAVFLIAFAFFAALFHRFPVLYDTDSYYHLAIARAYARHGLIDSLPWAQLSLLHEFGDKELLFHLLLAPWSDSADPSAGGRWALALLNALVATTLAALGIAAVGRWGLAVPVLVYGGSLDFLNRMIRLRPEILALLLLLAAVWCAARRRYRWLGLVAALYTLSYTAFHALLGLAVAWFCQRLWVRRRPEWELLIYPILGIGLGLVVHPHFPHNLVVWKVQSIDYFQHKDELNVGVEIGSHLSAQMLWLNLAWILGLLALWRAADPGGSRHDEPLAGLLWINAAAFGVLYLLMLRFSTYFIPMATLAMLYEIRRRGASVGRWTALPWRGRWPLPGLLAGILAIGVIAGANLLNGLAGARGAIPREAEWHAFGRQLPPGARVAAEWGSTHIYMFWAPQATFLNVLDPVFMKVRYPRAYSALRAVFEAREPDVPLAIKAELGCDYLALSRFHQPQEVLLRLAGDPRLRLSYQGYTLLYELVPEANADFTLDWRVAPQGSHLPPALSEIARWPVYPRASEPEQRAVEGYVDARRVAGEPSDCLALVHRKEVTEDAALLYELAPYGPTKVWVDDELVLSAEDTARAYLGRGIVFPVRLLAGEHRITVLTCPGRDGEKRSGFYLLDRTRPGTAPPPS